MASRSSIIRFGSLLIVVVFVAVFYVIWAFLYPALLKLLNGNELVASIVVVIIAVIIGGMVGGYIANIQNYLERWDYM